MVGLSQFALDGVEHLERDGVQSERKALFAEGFVTSDEEQFSSIFDMRMLGRAVFHILNLGEANAAKYTFYGAVDPVVKWEPLPNAQDVVLAADSSAVKTLTDAYGFVRVGVVSNVAESPTAFQVLAEGKSR